MFQLDCSVQNYAWGKLGSDSLVARFKQNTTEGFISDPLKTYSELWMGSHPSGPSVIKSSGQPENEKPLSEYLTENSEALGEKVLAKFGSKLPFLFKVLSVQKALSIQAHPSKSHAELLYRDNPNLYPDSNHKPEMAIALTPFEAFCGFRPLSEIQQFLKDVPELKEIVGLENAHDILSIEPEYGVEKKSLRSVFTALMTCQPEQFQPILSNLAERFSKKSDLKVPKELQELFSRIYSEFPGDIGNFGIFFFNYLKLKPTEAIFLAANEPHAYLFGDCVECMACSDNVVRAGLTPKHKDVETLCSMLTYQMRPKEDNIFEGEREDDVTVLFKVPVPDFAMASIQIGPDKEEYKLIIRDSASILLIVDGGGSLCSEDEKIIEMIPGTVVFISAGKSTVFKSKDNQTKSLLFHAFNVLE